MRNLYKKLKSKEYRDAFVAAHIQDGVSFQIRALRDQRKWNQRDLARALKVSQPAIAQYESPERALNLTTLQRVASAFDVALIVRFVPFSELARWAENLSTSALQVPEFEHDLGFSDGGWGSQALTGTARAFTRDWLSLASRREIGGTDAAIGKTSKDAA